MKSLRGRKSMPRVKSSREPSPEPTATTDGSRSQPTTPDSALGSRSAPTASEKKPRRRTTPQSASSTKSEPRVLVVIRENSKGQTEKIRITIQSDWKVTFGKFEPNVQGHDNTGTLRLYETKEKQRACFRNVISFWDESIQIDSPKQEKEMSEVESLRRDTESGFLSMKRDFEDMKKRIDRMSIISNPMGNSEPKPLAKKKHHPKTKSNAPVEIF